MMNGQKMPQPVAVQLSKSKVAASENSGTMSGPLVVAAKPVWKAIVMCVICMVTLVVALPSMVTAGRSSIKPGPGRPATAGLVHSFEPPPPLCHDDEGSALLHFKESLSIDNDCVNRRVASWKLGRETGDCCSWDGVECDNTGNVIGLDFSGNCLYGSINSTSGLFRLFHLKRLNLDHNNFNLSKITSGIINLSRLTHLNLSSSNFSDQIPSQVFQLFNLVSLDLSNNRFTGEISQLICYLTSALAIDLSNNNLSGTIPPCLNNLTSSTTLLNLGSNNFSSNIPEIYGTGCTLRTLDFSQNKLQGKIPRSLANCTKLKSINLSKNQIHDEFPFWLGDLPELKVLNLTSNKLYGAMNKSATNLDFSRVIYNLTGSFVENDAFTKRRVKESAVVSLVMVPGEPVPPAPCPPGVCFVGTP